MDIKPDNFVADSSDNLILCDWEQHDTPATTLAPEADGTWDVTEALPTLQDGALDFGTQNIMARRVGTWMKTFSEMHRGIYGTFSLIGARNTHGPSSLQKSSV
jgi:hypothetical protein